MYLDNNKKVTLKERVRAPVEGLSKPNHNPTI